MGSAPNWAVVALSLSSLIVSRAAVAGDIDNGNNRAWEVRYEDGHGNRGHKQKPDYDAVRLVIKKDSGNLIGDLWLYEIVNRPGGKEYQAIFGGRIALTQVTAKGNSGKHKRQEVLFEGTYMDGDGNTQKIHVGAVLHTLQGTTGTGRGLDRLTIRVRAPYDVSLVAGPAPAAQKQTNKSCADPAPGAAVEAVPAPAPDPCDAVPDMDILEETVVTNPALPPTMPMP